MRNLLKDIKVKDKFEHLEEFSNEELIEQIHKKVYSAEELLLMEAERIVNLPINTEKSERLKNLIDLGFTSEENVLNYKQEQLNIEKAKKIKSLIEYYKFKYPFNKFINDESVESICKEYQLLLAPVDKYIGSIPEKNQKEIVNFKVDINDLERRTFNVQMIDQKYAKGTNLLIIATKDELDKRFTRTVGHRLVEIVKDDPIVLQPVKDGYLIVSAWGPEASHKDVINPINN